MGAVALAASQACAADVPFASPMAGSCDQPFHPSLADAMSVTQWRYARLSQAGRAHDWPLAAYEAGKIEDAMVRAAMFYEAMPVAQVASATTPLSLMARAAAAGDAAGFDRAFDGLTAACNGCHRAAGIGFVAVRPFGPGDAGARLGAE